jgi:mannose-6-phosphate isomerase-like protein (cupin superfamily)
MDMDDMPRSLRGDVIENRVTGERAVVLRGTGDVGDGGKVAVHLVVRPGGAVMGEHVHSRITERFRVIDGKLGVRVDGAESVLESGGDVTVRPGVVHDWWNAGDREAQVLVEIQPGRRFELMIVNAFGLANAGKTNSKGMPNPLQLAVFGSEFRDVVQFVKPPRAVQRVLFGVLAPIGRAVGYRATYDEYMQRPTERVEPDPAVLALLDGDPQPVRGSATGT